MRNTRLFIIAMVLTVTIAIAQGPAWGVATVDDLRGMRLNPAYLGLGHGVETALTGCFCTDTSANMAITNNHGFSMNLSGLGVSYKRNAGLYSWSLGAGAGDRMFALGYLRTWTADDSWGGGWKNGWIFGMTTRPWEFLAAGYSFEDTPEADKLHRLGIGLRPATWRVTLFGEIAKPGTTSWNDFFDGYWENKVYYAVGGELHIVDGIHLFGRYDYYGEGETDPVDNITVGMRLDNPFGGVGFEAMSGPEDEWDRYTLYSTSSIKELPSVIPMPKYSLRIDLTGNYEENPRMSFFASKSKSFSRLIRTLEDAIEDNEIEGLVIRWRNPGLSFAQAEEFRRTLMKFRANEKPVILYADYLGNVSYYLASAADYIAISPTGGGVNLIGLRAELMFFKGTLDKIGVTPDFVTAGKYKSAMEMFTRTEPSEFAAQNMNEILDALDRVFIDGIAEAHGLSAEEVRKIVDGGPYTDIEAIEVGLVDSLMYWDEFEEYIDDERELETAPIGLYAFREKREVEWGEPDRIAVIVIDGNIVYGNGGPGGIFAGSRTGNREIVAAVNAAAKDKSVKGILLRVDSGGGSAVASDLMAHALVNAAEDKPVVVSMGGAAASGGYYVSAPGYRIFADAATITGSIGVISGKFATAGLYDKIGVTRASFQRGENSGIYSMADTFTVQQRERMTTSIDRFYDIFKKEVAAGRTLDIDSVQTIAQGRVWVGADAREIGLVDSIGGFIEALNFLIEESEAEENDLELWFMPSRGSLGMMDLLSQVAAKLPFADKLEDIPEFPFEDGETLFLMPYVIEIK